MPDIPTATTSGANKMIINGATMQMIVQHYFDTVLFKNADTKVQTVAAHESYTFMVGFIDKIGE